MTHPIQPLIKSEHGTIRFKKNAIVDYLLSVADTDLNRIMAMDFPDEDVRQFYQLIGVSLGLYGDLNCVSDEDYEAAERLSPK